jgi:hypothetical protein
VAISHVKDELEITISETILKQVFNSSLISVIAKEFFRVKPTSGNKQNDCKVIKLTNSPALLTSNNHNAIETFETMVHHF